MGTVEMPTEFQPFEIGENYVLGVWTDDLGVEYVQTYAMIVGSGLLTNKYLKWH